MADHKHELKNYETTKGSIHFQPDKPLPVALVRKLVKARIAENESRRKKIKIAIAIHPKAKNQEPKSKNQVPRTKSKNQYPRTKFDRPAILNLVLGSSNLEI